VAENLGFLYTVLHQDIINLFFDMIRKWLGLMGCQDLTKVFINQIYKVVSASLLPTLYRFSSKVPGQPQFGPTMSSRMLRIQII